MTTYYKATFSNGTVKTRSTASRKYSHAWFVQYPGWKGGTSDDVGFSGSEQLARKQLASFKRELTFSDVAPAVEITGAEYRAMKQADRDAAEELRGIKSVADRI